MDVESFDEAETTEAVEGVHLSLLAGADRMNVQGFAIEPGAVVPEHSHDNEQTGVVYEGELTFVVDGEELVVGEGDTYAIPANEPHAAENRGETTVRGIDTFSPPRTNPNWEE
ncbi:cupin domain-containing protein [Salinarchaeum laminariae]|uniref:cupin domain-containing protein n=1 Tax=Salinarchaeum laminariae TaxID=869888 RepID=UPI0020C123E0|nr:cupin domain-containing protein [Salinarchaeum laminariae]